MYDMADPRELAAGLSAYDPNQGTALDPTQRSRLVNALMSAPAAMSVGDSYVPQQDNSNSIAGYLGSKLAGIGHSIYAAATLPGDVWNGKVDPMSDQGIGRAADLAGMVTSGGMPMAEAGAIGSAGGKSLLSDLFQKSAVEFAARKAKAEELAAAGRPVQMVHNSGRSSLVGPDMSRDNGFRVTHFDEGGPMGHVEYGSLYDAIYAALREGYSPK